MSILEVNNVSIRYMTGDFKEIGLKEFIMRKATRNYQVKEFWADRDVSFSLEKGDMLGIIGTNGAGKSTLLKAISGIMEPTKGWVKREGTIAALLELGSGFDGELTVRENAYLRGAMLGYTRKFMDQTYADIIAFAELEEFQDRPFKQLSSGMKSRLAFSIASLVHPDILILDEVLSVGDGAFKRKSEAKMREIISGGATTILVSHSIQQVREMCNKVLWLHKGNQIAFGENVDEICDQYEAFLGGDKSALGKSAAVIDEASSGRTPMLAQVKPNERAEREITSEEKSKNKKILLGVLLTFLVINSGLIYYIHENFTPTIDYRENFESPLEYVWGSTEGEVQLSENVAKVAFEGSESKIYFYMFDNYKAPKQYATLATIPEGTKTIQFDCRLNLKPGLIVTAYIQQFDENGIRIERATKIEQINTETIRENYTSYAEFSYSIKAKCDSACKTFNILFDIRPNGEEGTFAVVDPDIILK